MNSAAALTCSGYRFIFANRVFRQRHCALEGGLVYEYMEECMLRKQFFKMLLILIDKKLLKVIC